MKERALSTRTRGFTLIEAMVAIGIFFVISLLVSQFLSYSMRGTTKMNERGSLNASLVRSLSWITGDLERTTLSHLLIIPQEIDTDPVKLCMVRSNGIDSLGTLIWEEEFVVYQWQPSDKGLTRYSGAGSAAFEPRNPALPSESLLEEVISGAQTSLRRLSGDVTNLEITRTTGALIKLQLQATSHTGDSIVVERTVRVQN